MDKEFYLTLEDKRVVKSRVCFHYSALINSAYAIYQSIPWIIIIINMLLCKIVVFLIKLVREDTVSKESESISNAIFIT